MTALRYSRRATLDLRDIADYSEATWGREQAARYLAETDRQCRRVADTPDIGGSAHFLGSGVRQTNAGSHVAYYRRSEDGVLILRILHARMDAGAAGLN